MMQLPENIPLEFAKMETAWTDNHSLLHSEMLKTPFSCLHFKTSFLPLRAWARIMPRMEASLQTAGCDCCFYGLAWLTSASHLSQCVCGRALVVIRRPSLGPQTRCSASLSLALWWPCWCCHFGAAKGQTRQTLKHHAKLLASELLIIAHSPGSQ